MKKNSLDIERFQIIGLNNYRNINICFKDPIKILVGENGVGKTSMINAMYVCLKCRWLSLQYVVFDFIEIEFNEITYSFSKSELDIYIAYLYQDLLLVNDIDLDNIKSKFYEIDSVLKEKVAPRLTYLPVYRNIEGYLKLMFGEISEQNVLDRLQQTGETQHDFETTQTLGETLISSGIAKTKQKFKDFTDTDNLLKFMGICNQYFEETEFVLTNNEFVLKAINKVNQDEVPIESLSSGEKQIIIAFGAVYLTNINDNIMLIDEPELSLSIPWQKKFLPDIIASGNCSFLFAITHSPFIFDNNLSEFAEGFNLYITD